MGTELKAWGNQELAAKDVGTDLAVQTYRGAIQALEDSELEEPSIEIPLRLNLAEALLRLGEWKDVVIETTLALDLEPGNAKALYRRGRANLQLDDVDLAKQDLVRAAKAAPQDRAIREALELAKVWVPSAKYSQETATTDASTRGRLRIVAERFRSALQRHVRGSSFVSGLKQQMLALSACVVL